MIFSSFLWDMFRWGRFSPDLISQQHLSPETIQEWSLNFAVVLSLIKVRCAASLHPVAYYYRATPLLVLQQSGCIRPPWIYTATLSILPVIGAAHVAHVRLRCCLNPACAAMQERSPNATAHMYKTTITPRMTDCSASDGAFEMEVLGKRAHIQTLNAVSRHLAGAQVCACLGPTK